MPILKIVFVGLGFCGLGSLIFEMVIFKLSRNHPLLYLVLIYFLKGYPFLILLPNFQGLILKGFSDERVFSCDL